MNGNAKTLPTNPYAEKLRALADSVESGQIQFLVVLDGQSIMSIGQLPAPMVYGILFDAMCGVREAAMKQAASAIQVVPSLAGLN